MSDRPYTADEWSSLIAAGEVTRSGESEIVSVDLGSGSSARYVVDLSNGAPALESLTFCVGAKFAETCATTLEYGGRSYARFDSPSGTGPGVGAGAGTASLLGCGDKSLPFVPVFTANEQPVSEAVTVSIDGSVRVYAAEGPGGA